MALSNRFFADEVLFFLLDQYELEGNDNMNRLVQSRTQGGVRVAPCKRMKFTCSEMAAAVKLNQQLLTEPCVVAGNGHCEA